MKKSVKILIGSLISTILLMAATTSVFAGDFQQTIINGLTGVNETIDVSSYQLSPQEAMNKYFSVLSENPDLFYVENEVNCTYDMKTGICNELKPVFKADAATIELQKAEFNQNINIIVSQANAQPTTYDKIKAVHDYLVTNYEYDQQLQNRSAYDMFNNGTGVCTAYTAAFNAAMKNLGINCTTVKSTSMNHAWSMVEVDGNWYHADVTWDDPINGTGIKYTNFLKSDKLMSASGHYNWIACNGAVANDTTYDAVI